MKEQFIRVGYEGVAQRQVEEIPQFWILLREVDAFGGHPARIEIRYQPGGIFTADLLVERQADDPVRFDCRPSDAIALAVRYDPPPEIFVLESLLEERADAGE